MHAPRFGHVCVASIRLSNQHTHTHTWTSVSVLIILCSAARVRIPIMSLCLPRTFSSSSESETRFSSSYWESWVGDALPIFSHFSLSELSSNHG